MAGEISGAFLKTGAGAAEQTFSRLCDTSKIRYLCCTHIIQEQITMDDINNSPKMSANTNTPSKGEELFQHLQQQQESSSPDLSSGAKRKRWLKKNDHFRKADASTIEDSDEPDADVSPTPTDCENLAGVSSAAPEKDSINIKRAKVKLRDEQELIQHSPGNELEKLSENPAPMIEWTTNEENQRGASTTKALYGPPGFVSRDALKSPLMRDFHEIHSIQEKRFEFKINGLVEKIIEVPDDAMGFIIGRGGENLARLRNESGCTSVEVPKANSHGGGPGLRRRIIIQGPSKHNVDACIAKMKLIMKEKAQQSNRNHNVDAQLGPSISNYRGKAQIQATTKMGHYSLTLEIPDDHIGYIIGPKGATLQLLHKISGAEMHVPPKEQNATGPVRRLVIITHWTQQGVYAAKELVENILASKTQFSFEQPTANFPTSSNEGSFDNGIANVTKVEIQNEEAGWLIGMKGATKKQLEGITGASIQVSPEQHLFNNTGNRVRTVIIRHSTAQGAFAAKQLIVNMLTCKRNSDQRSDPGAKGPRSVHAVQTQIQNPQQLRPQQPHLFCTSQQTTSIQFGIPDRDAGLCIGHQGTVLRKIQLLTGAKINISRDAIPGQTYRLAVITGQIDACEYTRQIMQRILGERSAQFLMN